MKRRDVLQAVGVALVASTAAAPDCPVDVISSPIAPGQQVGRGRRSSADECRRAPRSHTYTGLGDRGIWQAHRTISRPHQDMLAVIKYEDLRNVVIGHSYGGMVATGVADRAQTNYAADLSRCLRAEERAVTARSASASGTTADAGTREGG